MVSQCNYDSKHRSNHSPLICWRSTLRQICWEPQWICLNIYPGEEVSWVLARGFFYVFVCSFCFLLVFGSCICLMMYVLYMIYDLHDVIFKDWHSDAFLVMYAVCRLLFSFFCSLISSGSWNSATCLDLVRCGCRRPPEAQDTSGGGVGILWISEDTNQGCLILMAEIQVTTWNVPKPIIGIESMR